MNDLLQQADDIATTIGVMQHMYSLMQQMADTTHRMVGQTHELQEITAELRDHIADFDDFFRPIRNYFYWEQHCFNIPVCEAIRSVFDALDGVDEINDRMQDLVKNLDQLDGAFAPAARPVPADDRDHAERAHDDADDAQHNVRHLHPNGGGER